MASPLMRKAQRAAKSMVNGSDFLQIVTGDAARRAMKDSALEGTPSVAGISGLLLEFFDPSDLKHLPVRQFLGQAVRAVMEEEGYIIAETGVRLRDPIFRSGTVYELKAPTEHDDASLWIERLIGIMSDDEAAEAYSLLTKRLAA